MGYCGCCLCVCMRQPTDDGKCPACNAGDHYLLSAWLTDAALADFLATGG